MLAVSIVLSGVLTTSVSAQEGAGVERPIIERDNSTPSYPLPITLDPVDEKPDPDIFVNPYILDSGGFPSVNEELASKIERPVLENKQGVYKNANENTGNKAVLEKAPSEQKGHVQESPKKGIPATVKDSGTPATSTLSDGKNESVETKEKSSAAESTSDRKTDGNKTRDVATNVDWILPVVLVGLGLLGVFGSVFYKKIKTNKS